MPYYERKVTTTITVHMALLYGRLGKKGAHEKIVDSFKLLSTLLQKRTLRAEDLLSDSSQSVM